MDHLQSKVRRRMLSPFDVAWIKLDEQKPFEYIVNSNGYIHAKQGQISNESLIHERNDEKAHEFSRVNKRQWVDASHLSVVHAKF